MKKISFTLVFIAALFTGISMLVIHSSHAQEAAQKIEEGNSYNETYRQLNLFGDVFERVRAEYVEEINDKELIENALNGMLSSLDPHSGYLSEEKFADMRVETKGEFGGLGIEVTMENGLVKVVSPIDDTPAFRAGIQSGDYIVKIDDETVMGMSLSDAVGKMRGKVGSTIDLSIAREGEDTTIEVTIIRDIIQIKSVRHRTEGNVGYIRITTFSEKTGPGVHDAIKNISKELGDNLLGYVLDLRNNPGGLLSQAIEVADIFLDKGEIVSQRGRYEEDTERNNATPGDMAENLPIVVLINGGSASASEIVAGALQDHKRAILMGMQSFGKGSVQTVMPFPGNGAMRLTTARYYTPSGLSIQAKGITPDIIVEPAMVEALSSKRMREADLPGALDKEKNKKPANDNKKDKKDKKNKEGKDEEKEEDEINDYQLLRALDLLKGLSLYQPIAKQANIANIEGTGK
ncbi:MAG: S41 family peptidase [Alphaproteobacteria bacterium]|nr:S41 family peptidase [Alphaproteobacteria bacterium]